MSKIEIDTKDILEVRKEYGREPTGKVIFRGYNMDMLYEKMQNSNSDISHAMRYSYHGGFIGGRFPNDIRKPKRYIINKGATILFWEDGTKTIVKRSKDDKYNKRLGFLTAYFQKHSGLTKNQANKYLDALKDEDDLKNKI